MIRHCDGTDPYLVKRVPNEDDPNAAEYVPCDCGLRFDDVYHLTVYPHERF